MAEAREAFDASVEAERENLIQAERDLRFLAGEQWEAEDKRERLRTGRPALTINRLPQYLRQVTGDMRLNPPGGKVRPVDGGADVQTAEVYNGLIRNIEAQSNAKGAYVTAGENAAKCGQGFFRINYDYVPGSFDMEISVGRLASPFAAIFYAGTVDPTGADADGCFVQDLIPVRDFEKRYPKASLTSWDDNALWGEWKQGDFIRIAEWWRRVPVKRDLVLCQNMKVFDVTDMEPDVAMALVQGNGGMLRERKADSYRVEMRAINGMEELEERSDWPGCYLPIIRVVGEETNIGDRLVRGGLIRNARDAQVLFNVQRSSLAEAMAMAPKAKWLGTTKNFAATKRQWANANQLNFPFLTYTPDKDAPGPPQRIAPEMPAAGLLQDVTLAAQDIEATIGIYRENLGKESNAQSGRAILSRQREGDVGTFLYTDNLADAVVQGVRVMVDIIPRVYDTPRIVRVLGEDGQHDTVRINFVDPMTGQKIVDLSAGRYDVVPSVGPSYSTKREEARESMMAYFHANPQAATQMGDIFAKAMDWPGADEFASRARRIAIMQGLVDPDPQNPEDAKIMQALQAKGQQPSPEMVLAQAEQEKAKAAQMKVQADAQIRMRELQIKQAEVVVEAMKAEKEAQQNGIKLSIQAADVESKIRERHAGMIHEGLKTTLDTVERVVGAHVPPMQPQEMRAPPGA